MFAFLSTHDLLLVAVIVFLVGAVVYAWQKALAPFLVAVGLALFACAFLVGT